jgi:glycosyltransferase involved in cell wall biosynthesis
MNITVILCTYNRGTVLADALGSVAASALPESVEWEVLVVDNNSSDRTRDVVEGFCRRYPSRFRYVFESRPGKSYALNTAIREARGQILAFMDDDATVGPEWLRNLSRGLLNGDWAGAGGRIVLQWPSSLAAWLAVEGPLARHPFPGFDQGHEAGQLAGPPYGANMAFRKEMFEKYGGFRTDLGPSPNRDIPRPNEDTEFGRRLIAAGERLRYEPSAVVFHPVDADRINRKYFLEWWFDYGRAMVREWGRGPDVWGIPRPYLNILATLKAMVPRIWRWILTLNPQRRFYWKCWVWMDAGEIREFYRRARSKDTRVQLANPYPATDTVRPKSLVTPERER